MTFKILVEVVTGYYLGFIIALAKDHPQVLVGTGIALHGIHGAGAFIQFAFPIVNVAVAHNIFHILLAYVAALHAAFGMLGIFYVREGTVEATVALTNLGGTFRCVEQRLALASFNNDDQDSHYN